MIKRNIFLILLIILITNIIIISNGCTFTKEPLLVYVKDSKAAWYQDALTLFQIKYTKVKIAIVYHEKWENDDGSWSDLRINSSDEALKAYRRGIKSSYFIGKEGLVVQDNTIVTPENGCYTGVFPGWGEYEDSVKGEELINFEKLSGKSVAFVPFSVFFGRNYVSRKNLGEISKYGAIPLVRFMPWGEPYWEPEYQPRYSLQRIINGDFDSFISRWADTIKDYGKPVMVTFGVEMNGDWFPWSGVFQGGGKKRTYGDPDKPDGPERFVDAFHHIVNLFREKNVKNAIWYFQPNDESYPQEEWNKIENYYPGDEYVDWIGFSLYGAQTHDEPWVKFEEKMEPIYKELTTLFPNKPLFLAEWGVMEREED